MASTILRFRNPNIFQIIDQRAYRFIYDDELILTNPSTENTRDVQIKLYLKYLEDLKGVANKTGWEFSQLDRALYLKDQKFNKKDKIK